MLKGPNQPTSYQVVGSATAEPPAAFLTNVHWFRGVAIVAVVATHVLFEFDWRPEVLWEFKLSLSLMQNGTVLFVFVAGLLFQHLAHRFSYRTYLWSKCKFVLLPYLLVSLPYVWLQYVRQFGIFGPGIERRFESPLLHAAGMYLSGAQMPIPLWFVPMIALFYLAAPLFLWVDANPRRYWAIVPLLILASFVHRPQNHVMLRQSFVYFLPVYLCGMWTSRYMTQVMPWVRRLLVPGLMVMVGLTAFEVITRQRPGAIESAAAFSTERGVFDVNIYTKLGLSFALLYWLQSCPKWLAKLLDPLASASFGIFFVHFYIVYFARDVRRWAAAAWPGTFLSVACYTAIVVVLSVVLVWGLRKALGPRSRFVIGC